MRAFSILLLALTVACASDDGEKSQPGTTAPDPTGTPGPTGTTDTDTLTDTDTPTTAPIVCTPPTRQVLADIPDQASLAATSENVLAAFAVDGDQLVGKLVRDPGVAEGALTLWQEVVLRIPLDQRAQLVQFTLFEDPDLAGYVDNSGTSNQSGRVGVSLYVTADYAREEGAADPCAPLQPRRGNFDWTLIHEFGHLRQYADGTVDDFVERFGNETGDGEGYPEDGSPVLDGDFVTSYAERAGGDEDAAETFTTFVMLDEPAEDSLAAEKVRFFWDQPDYQALRLALRVTEPGGGADVPAAPLRAFDLEINNPSWLLGTWSGTNQLGPVEYEITADDVIYRQTIDGVTDEVSYAHLRDDGTLAVIKILESSEEFHLHQVSIGDLGYSESFRSEGAVLSVDRERVGEFTLTRAQ